MNVQIVIPPAFQFNGGLQSFEIIMSLDFYSATWITTQNFDVFDLVTISVKTPIHGLELLAGSAYCGYYVHCCCLYVLANPSNLYPAQFGKLSRNSIAHISLVCSYQVFVQSSLARLLLYYIGLLDVIEIVFSLQRNSTSCIYSFVTCHM